MTHRGEIGPTALVVTDIPLLQLLWLSIHMIGLQALPMEIKIIVQKTTLEIGVWVTLQRLLFSFPGKHQGKWFSALSPVFLQAIGGFLRYKE